MDDQQRRLAEELLFAESKKASFAKKLYFGMFNAEQVFPFPAVSPEEKERTETLVLTVVAFAEKEIDPVWIDRNSTIPDSVIKGLGRLGVFGITVPKQWGGLDMSQYAFCRVTSAIARRCGSTALFINVQQSIGLKSLLLFGNDAQKEKWLPALVKGEKLAAFALTEPNAGSDAAGIETRALYDPVNQIYRLTGCKQWITSGGIADVLTVMAKTEDGKISAFLVTPDMPGFKVVESALDKVGTRGTKTAILEFQEMVVPAQNILGKPGGGLKIALTLLDYGRTTFGAMCTGAAQELVERATQHAINRYQFKRPLASFALVKKKIALMAALLYAMEATTYLTAGLVDAQVEDIMLESAMLKVFASDSLWTIVYESMQILGGRSFFADAPYERMMRDARLNMIGEGSNEVMRAFIGAVGMRDVGMQLKKVLEAVKKPWSDWETLKHFAQEKWQAPKVPVHSSQLWKEADRLGKAVKRFGYAVTRLLATYREEIVERQLLLDRIATTAMALYTITAVLSRVDHPHVGETEMATAKLYCSHAFNEIDKNLDTLFENQDEALLALADQITDLKKRWQP
jgi:acyl-CoA dehydrogenase family protein 9